MLEAAVSPPSSRFAFLALVLLLAVGCLSGCDRRADERAGATAEREEIRGGHRIVLKSRVTPRRVTLGDPAVWTLSAELPASGAPGKLLRSPAGSELDLRAPRSPSSESVRSGEAAARDGDRTLWTWVYQVRGFGLGTLALPAVRLPVIYGGARDTLLFPPDTLAVDSLTRAMTGTVLPDRGVVTPELRPVDYAVAGLLLLLAVVAVLLIVRAVRRRRKGPTVVPVPVEAPEAVLRREVAALRATGEPMPRDAFYDRLSLAIRDYAAAAARITTRDRTTLEIVRDLRARAGAPPEGIDALRRALARADLAKFARSAGGWDEALEVLALAEGLPERFPVQVEAPPPLAKEG